MTELEKKLALKDKELKEKIAKGQIKVCNTENQDNCINCGS